MIAAWIVDRSGKVPLELGVHTVVALPRAGEVIGVTVGDKREWFVVERLDHHAEPAGNSDRLPQVSILVARVDLGEPLRS